jgi:hypothetical protein
MQDDPIGLVRFLNEISAILGALGNTDNGLFSFFLNEFYPRFRNASTFVSLILITGIIYAKIRLRQVLPEAHHAMIPGGHGAHHGTGHGVHEEEAETPPSHAGRARWEVIMNHLASTNQGDWRLAVIEADILLDTMLEEKGVPGMTIGERLKVLKTGDMKTLNQAWEAHKIRNAIAHQGADFLLSEREAKRVVSLYREVFQEFDYI